VGIVERTTRFGGFPALRIGKLYAVWGFRKRKFGVCRPRAVETKNGLCDLTVLNVGYYMFLREAPICAKVKELRDAGYVSANKTARVGQGLPRQQADSVSR
jgi:hypothetical protein